MLRSGALFTPNLRRVAMPSPVFRRNFAVSAPATDRIPITIINGSVRPGNYTSMASSVVADEFRKQLQVSLTVVNPVELNLSPPGIPTKSDGAQKLQKLVKDSAAVVLATPEYHGSFSSVMKLVIESLGFPSVLASKPIALLGVAAGGIGAIKSLEHLRGVCSHVGAIVLPLPISIANCQKTLSLDASGKTVTDPATEKLLRSVATGLLHYLQHSVCPAITLERLVREGNSAVMQQQAARK